MRGERVGHGPPAVEREAWELRVLGAVILQALGDMLAGDGEAEAWLAEAIGLDGDEMRGLAREFVRRRGRGSFDSGLRPSAQDDKGGRGMKGERVCRHCGESYRGLACPCRKRAAAERRAKDEGRRMKDEGAEASVGSDDSDHSDGLSGADGKG